MRILVPFLLLIAPAAYAAEVKHPAAEVREYIEKHPKATLDQVVKFANRSVVQKVGIPLMFYSLTGGGEAVPLKPVHSRAGTDVPVRGPFEDACGFQAYSLPAKHFDKKSVTVAIGGKDEELAMPSSFVVGIFSAARGSNPVSEFEISSTTMPIQVSEDGSTGYFIFPIPNSPGVITWWLKTMGGHDDVLRMNPHLVYSVSKDGARMTSDLSRYTPVGKSAFAAEKLKNGTYAIHWTTPNGLSISLSNMCAPNHPGGKLRAMLESNILIFPKFDAADFSAAKSRGPVLLVFTKSNCPVCHMQIPALEEVLKTDPFSHIPVFQVNFVEQRDLDRQFGVTNQNTLILYKGGNEINRSTGMTEKTVLKNFISKVF